MTITLTALQKQRRDTASNWTSNNTVLLAGEWGIESDTKKFKIGDGSTAWQSLDYVPIPDTNRLLTGNLTVGGNLDVKGTTTTVSSVDVSTKDANIHLAKVASGSFTGNCAASAATITNVSDTTNLAPGVAISISSGGGSVTLGTARVLTVDSETQITLNVNFGGSSSATGVTFSAGGGTNFSADGGGITVEAGSDTDKTFNWVSSTSSWTSSEHINLLSSKVLKIAGTQILSATALGSSVVSSSLTSLGTIATGVWQGTPIGSAYMTAGTTSVAGAVQLTDSTSSTSTTTAATPNSVKTAKDAADTAQTTANAALPKAGGQISGNITCAGTETFDGRDLSVDGSKLDGIEASADVTDATNVNAAGAIMESDVDAKGDLLAGTADNTVARLAVGTDGYVLKADSSAATGLAWAVDAGGIPTTGGSFTGDVTLANQSDARFAEATANGSNYVGFQAPASVASNILWTLPATDASVSGHALVSDASGTLSWAEAGGGGAQGGGGEKIFHESENQMDNNYTISTNHNAVVPSPLTINATLTINSGSVVTFV